MFRQITVFLYIYFDVHIYTYERILFEGRQKAGRCLWRMKIYKYYKFFCEIVEIKTRILPRTDEYFYSVVFKKNCIKKYYINKL